MAVILKGKTRLRVREFKSELKDDVVLGTGIDVLAMPDSHLSCSKCSKPFWEVWVYGDNHRIEIGCLSCGWSTRLLLPMDIDLAKRFGEGKFECQRWSNGKIAGHVGFIIIKNNEYLSIGCRYCKTEVNIKCLTKSNLIMAN